MQPENPQNAETIDPESINIAGDLIMQSLRSRDKRLNPNDFFSINVAFLIKEKDSRFGSNKREVPINYSEEFGSIRKVCLSVGSALNVLVDETEGNAPTICVYEPLVKSIIIGQGEDGLWKVGSSITEKQLLTLIKASQVIRSLDKKLHKEITKEVDKIIKFRNNPIKELKKRNRHSRRHKKR